MRLLFAATLLMAALLMLDIRPAHAQSDTTPPTWIELTIEPAVVNTLASDQVITLTATISDDIWGVKLAYLGFGPEFGTGSFIYVTFGQEWGTLIEGDDLYGTYQDTITIPQGTREGDWVVKQLTLEDYAGNKVSHFGSHSSLPEWLQQYRFTVEQLDSTPVEPNYALYLPTLSTVPAED